jgi:hypothetical protein
MYSDVYKAYRANQNMLGLPISNQATISTGAGIFCERGIVWAHPNLKGKCLAGAFTPPLMGQAVIVQAGAATSTI